MVNIGVGLELDLSVLNIKKGDSVSLFTVKFYYLGKRIRDTVLSVKT